MVYKPQNAALFIFTYYLNVGNSAKQYAGNLIHDFEKDMAMVGLKILHMELISSKIDSLAPFFQGKGIIEISNNQLFAYIPADCPYMGNCVRW